MLVLWAFLLPVQAESVSYLRNIFSRTSDDPIPKPKCFESHEELAIAVYKYLQDSSPSTKVSTIYGHPMATWCLSDNVTSLDDLFFRHHGADNFQEDLSGWNTAGVTSMSRTFYKAENINFDVSRWDTRRVISMDQMFQDATSFEGVGLETWRLDSMQSIDRMFDGASSLSVNLCSWGQQINTKRMSMSARAATSSLTHPQTRNMFRDTPACPASAFNYDHPDFSRSPPGPFCHWCSDDDTIFGDFHSMPLGAGSSSNGGETSQSARALHVLFVLGLVHMVTYTWWDW